MLFRRGLAFPPARAGRVKMPTAPAMTARFDLPLCGLLSDVVRHFSRLDFVGLGTVLIGATDPRRRRFGAAVAFCAALAAPSLVVQREASACSPPPDGWF